MYLTVTHFAQLQLKGAHAVRDELRTRAWNGSASHIFSICAITLNLHVHHAKFKSEM